MTTIPQRGAVVQLGRKEVSGLYELWATIDGLTAPLFTERTSDRDVKQLCRAVERMRNAVDDSSSGQASIAALLDAKYRYYDICIHGADNEEIRASGASGAHPVDVRDVTQ